MVHKKWLDKSLLIGEIVKEENIRLVYLLDLRADFGVKTNAKDADFQAKLEFKAVCTQKP